MKTVYLKLVFDDGVDSGEILRKMREATQGKMVSWRTSTDGSPL